MKKAIIILLVALLGGGGFWYWKQKKKNGRDKEVATRIVKVEKGTLEETVEATGEVTPMNRVEIKPPIAGRIEELLVDEGATVKRGTILAWMSSSDRAAILDAARAKGPAELKKWEDSYKPTPIIAPLSGVLILKNVVVGQTVEPSTILFAMSDRLIVLAQVDESDIGRVKLKLPTRIVLDAYPNETIDGEVVQILHEGKNVSNVITYGVKILPKETPTYFRSQMTANITVILDRRDNVLVLPAQAVRDGEEGPQVMTPNPNGKPISRSIRTGLSNGNQVEVLEGLSEGDAVLVSRARYTPQKGPQQSPLTFGGQRQSQNQQGQRNRQGQ